MNGRFRCLLLLGIATTGTAFAADAPRVAGEPSRTVAHKAAPAWQAQAVPSSARVGVRYGEMSAERILKLRRDNAARHDKPLQIGIGREAARESDAPRLPALRWAVQADGSSLARIELLSPLAYGIRVGLDVSSLDPRAQLQFSGSARPGTPVATLAAGTVLALADGDRIFWTPATDGEAQFVDIRIPPGIAPSAAQVQAPRLIHLMANPVDDFKILKELGDSGSCNVDVVCRVNELGTGYANVKSAVARMIFVKNDQGYYCTGTLLNDTVTATQVPYFHTANHCIGDQAVAATLNTYWNYESTTCNVDVAANYTQLVGGADYLYSNADTDGALLRLREPAPAGTAFAGWDANALPASSAVTAIHHPSGDLKKVSAGQHVPADSDGYNHAVGWLQGTTEGGSSGSGLFTTTAGQYYLRGGLWGGDALCSNSGSLSNAGNRDWYSRFDVDFPHIRQYLAPEVSEPRRRNGSQPLMHR